MKKNIFNKIPLTIFAIFLLSCGKESMIEFTGTATDYYTHEALQSATVTISRGYDRKDPVTVVTDVNGEFTLFATFSDTFYMESSKSGYESFGGSFPPFPPDKKIVTVLITLKPINTPTDLKLPEIKTSQVSEIGNTNAKAGAILLSVGSGHIYQWGICLGTEKAPTTTNNTKFSALSTEDTFSVELTDLIPDTTYYVRAYAINDAGTAYGEDVQFKTTTNKP